jgi:hypothetical protein
MQQTQPHYDWLTNSDNHKHLTKAAKSKYSLLDDAKINKPIITKKALELLKKLK